MTMHKNHPEYEAARVIHDTIDAQVKDLDAMIYRLPSDRIRSRLQDAAISLGRARRALAEAGNNFKATQAATPEGGDHHA